MCSVFFFARQYYAIVDFMDFNNNNVTRVIALPLIAVSATNSSECRLLSGAFSYFVQFSLGVLALSSLYIKWKLERPQRAYKVVVHDVLKQAISACFCHGFNMLLAVALSRKSGDGPSDECAWYFLNYIFDTLFAVFLAWGLLRALESGAKRFEWTSLQESGTYFTTGEYRCFRDKLSLDRTFSMQLISWTVILLLVKGFLAIPLVLLRQQLTDLGNAMFRSMWDKPKTELALVMVLAPCLCNIIQFWIYDQMIMKGGSWRMMFAGCTESRKEEGELTSEVGVTEYQSLE